MKRLLGYKWELVFWLFLAFFLNQADRQIFNVLLKDIQTDLCLTSSDMGLVSSILTLVYGILVPVAGLMGDRISKKYIILVALLVWSSATLATGVSSSLLSLVLLRSVATGGGEAFYSPSANALISENHGEETKATALSIHQTALYLGFICSSIIATAIAEAYGWRNSFVFFGGAGILLAFIIAWRIKPDLAKVSTSHHGDTAKAFKAFFKSPTALLLTLGCAGLQFVGTAFYTWMPTYLQDPDGFALDRTRAAFDATFYFQAASIVGVLAGARLGDKYVSKISGIRGWIQVFGFIFGAPFIYFMATSASIRIVNLSLFGFGLFKGMYDSNMFASLYEVIEEKYRAAATSFMLMIGFIVGSVSPYLLGVMEPRLGLSNGLAMMSIVYFLSSIPVIVATIFTMKREKVISLH